MGLQLKLSTPVVNDAGTLVTLTDITGVYNATTNPTGYSPGNIDVVDLLNIIVSLPDVSGNTLVFDSSSTPTAQQVAIGTPFDLSATQFGLDRFPDSVMKINYQVVGDTTVAMSYTLGSQEVSGSNTAPVIDLVKRISETGASMTIVSSSQVVYNTDPSWLYILDALSYLIDTEFPYTTGVYATYPAAQLLVYANVQSQGEECLASDIGDLAINLTTKSCKQTEQEAQLMKRYLYELVAQTKFDCKDYATADRINKFLADFCNTPTKCGCS
jgi:hypothetical protein